ncbi:PDZ domain-containing protein [candidate division KSB1 bacterium]|nr:PDZ domain-containing protein [candidate division KSB1 bacterium]
MALFATAEEKDKQLTIHYEWRPDTETHNGSVVSIMITNNNDSTLTFSMPGWTPGAYRFAEYGRHVREVKARNHDHQTLRVDKLDDDSWQVQAGGNHAIAFTYRVEKPLSFFGGRRDDSTHIQLEGPSTFMYLEGGKAQPVTACFHVPSQWKLACGLDSPPKNLHDATARCESAEPKYLLYAPNYNTFIDAPVEMSQFEERTFTIGKTPFHVVMHGVMDFDIDGFVNMVKKICAYQIELMNDVPFTKYVFLYHINPGFGGGGLEHLNSTTISLSAPMLKESVTAGASVTAHEFFHLWNVKRIRPKVLGPFDYSQPVRTKALWFSEGVTSYYADLAQVRTGLVTPEQFLDMQARQIRVLQNNPDRLKTSAEQASWEIWDRGYGSSGVNYYNKGQLLGLLLDLRLRHETGNKKSLDDMFRYLNQNYAKLDKGFEEDELPEIASRIAGKDLRDFFTKYVAGVEELPYQEYLAWAGIEMEVEQKRVATLGNVRLFGPQNSVIMLDDGPAAQAGLQRRDLLKEVNGTLIKNQHDLDAAVAAKAPGDTLRMKVARGEETLMFEVKLDAREDVSYRLSFLNKSSQQQLEIREGLLALDNK